MVNGPLSFGNHLFENTVNILTFAIEELEQTIIESPATISDFEKRAYEGTEADITALTSDIGKILSVKIADGGFNYSTAPKTTCEATFILKDVTGAYVLGNSFTTHTGSVITFDTTSKTLRCTITDSERIEQETSGTINEFMRLEDDGIFDGVYLDEKTLKLLEEIDKLGKKPITKHILDRI